MNKFVCIIVLFVFAITSCATPPLRNVAYPESGRTNNSAIVVKDYEPVAIVYATAQEIIYKPGDHTGSKITHEMLMKEAEKHNAHDVINVKIDVKHKEEILNNGTVKKTTYDYTAVGLAIRYTRAVEGVSIGSTDINTNLLPEIQEQDNAKKKRRTLWWTLGSIVVAGLITGIVIGVASSNNDDYYNDGWNNNYGGGNYNDPYWNKLFSKN